MRVDWVSPSDLADALPGRLGLTFLPGKRGRSSRYPGHTYRRDASDDLAQLHAQGVRSLVLLVEEHELARWSDPEIVELGRSAGIDVQRFPIPDGGVPTIETMEQIQGTIGAGRAHGDVAVACMGGVGRTGTVAACALVSAGRTAPEAIARVREIRHPTAVETDLQERFVSAWERHAPAPSA